MPNDTIIPDDPTFMPTGADDQMQAAMVSLKGEGPSFGSSIADAFTRAASDTKEDLGLEGEEPVEPVKAAPATQAAPVSPAAKPSSPFAPPVSDEPAAPADSDLPPPDAVKGKHAGHWKRMHARVAEMQQEKAALEAKLAGAGKAAPDEAAAAELKRIRAERDELSEIVKVAVFDRHPETRARFEPQLKSVVELGRSLVTGEQKDQIAALLSQPPSTQGDEAISAIADTLPSFKQSQLAVAVATRNRLHLELGEMRAKSGEHLSLYDKQAQEKQAKTRADQDRAMGEDFDSARRDWSSFPLYADKPGDAAHNAAAAEARATAEKIFRGGLSSRELALAAHWVPVGPKLAEHNKALLVENTRLRAENAGYRKAEPGGGTGQTGGVPTPAQTEADTNMGWGAIITREIGRSA